MKLSAKKSSVRQFDPQGIEKTGTATSVAVSFMEPYKPSILSCL
jgi:hypothetical protein